MRSDTEKRGETFREEALLAVKKSFQVFLRIQIRKKCGTRINRKKSKVMLTMLGKIFKLRQIISKYHSQQCSRRVRIAPPYRQA